MFPYNGFEVIVTGTLLWALFYAHKLLAIELYKLGIILGFA